MAYDHTPDLIAPDRTRSVDVQMWDDTLLTFKAWDGRRARALYGRALNISAAGTFRTTPVVWCSKDSKHARASCSLAAHSCPICAAISACMERWYSVSVRYI